MSKPVMEDLFSFEGRRNRKSYILASFVVTGGMLAVAFFAGMAVAFLNDAGAALMVLAFIVTLAITSYASLAISAQRFHDMGFTGWLSLLLCIPGISWGVRGVLWMISGTPGVNKYGPDPLHRDHGAEILAKTSAAIHRG